MPELPEVETVRRSLARELAGRRIVNVREIGWPSIVAAPTPDELCLALCDRAVERVDRRAKYVLIRLDNDETLAVHLRMTGQLLVVPGDAPSDKHTHIILSLDDGRELRFHDTRKFGRWWLLNADGLAELESRLGDEPLGDGFTLAAFQARLAGRRTKLKPLLLDQSVVAGIGNIYADEALWMSRLHPLRTADSLDEDEVAALHASIIAALDQGIQRRGTTLVNYRDASGASGENQDYLNAYGRTGAPCPRCGTPIERIIVAQRSTHICPTCQRQKP
jgi:formamidopyrimidine-DNA glycosylase